jgi:predicted ATP-dependent endonuclease of OLD family
LYFNSFGARSNVFIIDEPELSLHLRWQEMLLEKMIESNPRAQIIVATHSPEIVGELRDNCVSL